MILTNAQIIMATAQAFHESGLALREIWCSDGLKVVYTWVDDSGNKQSGWFLFSRGISYNDMVEAIKNKVTFELLFTRVSVPEMKE